MLKFLKHIFDEQAKKIDEYQKVVDQINALEPSIKRLSDTKLAAQTKKFRQIIADERENGRTEAEILDQLLPEAFATVRESARRVLGMRHYDVQLLAGVALHHGMVTEQKTGEGKTLTVTAPLYLNALLGKGSHLVTVNDYLAEIGCGWMGPVYDFLGLTTAVIVHDKAHRYDPEIDSEERGDERLEHFQLISRREAYACDITYGTNNEFGFDYLRDNMVQELPQMVQRTDTPHQFAIVDEADSILIDEARTPLIISAPDTDPTDKYYQYAKMVTTLVKDTDYKLDEKTKTAHLTDLGLKRVEQKLGVTNLYEQSYDTIHHIETALKAGTLYQRDQEYIIRDNQVVIVDEHTGRLMHGRRYSDGLHQAIEAKEGVPIQQESRTLATISLQNYFRLYSKLAGMTGTAVTEAEEFKQIYDMDVLVIPTHRPVVRDDRTDLVYKSTAAKYSAIANAVEEIHQTGQPVLIGTKSIEHNQIIANFLKRKKVPHKVLNAKNNEKEAFIIAEAGNKGSITVATNIAGRGVDIVLGGAKPELKDYRKKKTTSSTKLSKKTIELAKQLSLPPSINPNNYKLASYQKALETWQSAHDEVISLGGLFVIGTERHESRRIDNQLRGRSGRQGDPGASQFFVSLEDDIMRLFGGDKIANIMDTLKLEDDQPIQHGMVSKAIESAQVKVEGFFFDQRKRLVDFDDVMNTQREIIYQRRRRLLNLASQETENTQEQSLKSEILDYLDEEVQSLVMLRSGHGLTDDEIDGIVKEFIKIIPFDDNSQAQLKRQLTAKADQPTDVINQLTQIAHQTYQARENTMGEAQMRLLERIVMLSTIDAKWMDHLDEMDNLRDGIWLRGDKKTVLSEYKKEAFAAFETLIQLIESTVISRIFRVQLQAARQPVVNLDQAQAQKDDINESLEKEVKDATPPGAAGAGRPPTTTQGSTSDLASALGTAKVIPKPQPGISKAKIGRNDPCPCGSGLKYKKCGLINAPEHQA